MNVALEIKATETLPNGWRVVRLHAPELARDYQPGLLARIDNHPYPVMSCDAVLGSLSIALHTEQTLTDAPCFQGWQGEALSLPEGPCLLLGQDHGIFALVPVLAALRKRKQSDVLVMLAATGGFPFQPAPSRIYLPDMPGHVIATMPLLNDWAIPGRLASPDDLPGCFEGELTEFAEYWLTLLGKEQCQALDVIVSGSLPWCETLRDALAPRVKKLQTLGIASGLTAS